MALLLADCDRVKSFTRDIQQQIGIMVVERSTELQICSLGYKNITVIGQYHFKQLV